MRAKGLRSRIAWVISGYRYGALRLYLAASDENSYAYLVSPNDSERWPRSDPMTLCA
jgi:hypothetical protein